MHLMRKIALSINRQRNFFYLFVIINFISSEVFAVKYALDWTKNLLFIQFLPETRTTNLNSIDEKLYRFYYFIANEHIYQKFLICCSVSPFYSFRVEVTF